MADYETYALYINDHIQRVKAAWEKMKACEGFPYRSDETFKAMVDCFVENHDNSKFSDEEFDAYAKRFYPEEGDVLEDGEFERAVNHHYKLNPHHWQWWVTEDGVRVVNNYLRYMFLCEMVSDWMAVGELKGNTATSYFREMEDKIILDSWAKDFVIILLRAVEPQEWEGVPYGATR